ncbi:fatty acid desaturase [Nordella sp. HKS 07]|uniref:fatty acid desaturase n=1 Tax=Nordella sp. HKS 07 TaxID=2712222 RepID=UPI0013E150E5|nr:fatty acid desaturase [Nordella sp. HKS 07]QIG47507.1 fatty acid desaturase [Nordella sp. HKS 07]
MSEVDHRALLAGLTAEQRCELTGLSDGKGLLQLALHLALIFVLALPIAFRVSYWPLFLLPLGIALIFLFTALHESVHGTAFKSAWLNQAVAHVAGFIVLVPATWFRYFHFAHHRHTHDDKLDPELMAPKPETIWQYVKYLSGVPVWISLAKSLCVNALGRGREDFVPEKAKSQVVREARVTLSLYGLCLATSLYWRDATLLWLWIVPVLLGQPFLRAFLLAEHARCPHVANMLANTRTTYTTRFMRFLAWNMPYHAEHHAYPIVPFHQLPAFHEIAEAHLKETERGYARFNRNFAAGLR